MRHPSNRKSAFILALFLALSVAPSFNTSVLAADALPLIPLAALNEQARIRLRATPRLNLAATDAAIFKEAATNKTNAPLDPMGTSAVPNYLRALGATMPGAVAPFANLMRAAIYKGQLAPEVKLAMGLRMAQINSSPYVAAHMQRLLRTTDAGNKMLAHLAAGDLSALAASDRAAIAYAEALTRDIHGVGEAEFRQTRGAFNDSQIVELTMTVAFFNYFTRMAEALNLPVETWALDDAKVGTLDGYPFQPSVARVGLISDDEIGATIETVAAIAKDAAKPNNGLGLGMANSQRAMLRAPAFALAWRAYGAAVRDYAAVNREIKLHVSFAVSMANGCRYCTLHQVLGLRRLGVEPAKLIAMKKDDAALSPRELAAVVFARKLTRQPSSVTDADFAALTKEFTEQGALEVALQTCAFNFMNRFTDGLHLPSEDEAIRVYRETYGQNSLR